MYLHACVQYLEENLRRAEEKRVRKRRRRAPYFQEQKLGILPFFVDQA
jgi:hypothetical protein